MATLRTARARPARSSALTPPEQLTALRNRFLELFGRKLPRRDFAKELARSLTQTLHAKAAVVMAYDRHCERLVVLAEEDLGTAGCAVLEPGANRAWDIPIRGLRNRRISVIEAAEQNPFVPRPLIDVSPRGLTIASIPVYQQYRPAGVVLLFAASRRAFPDAELQMLSRALRVVARGLAEPGDDEAQQADQGEDPGSAITAAASAQLASVREPPAERPGKGESAALATETLAQGLLARVKHLEGELARAHADLERAAHTEGALAASRQAVVRERDALTQQIEDAKGRHEADTADLRARVASLEDRVLASESERVRVQRQAEKARAAAEQALRALKSERDEAMAQLRLAESKAAAAGAERAGASEESKQLAARVETLERELHGSRSALDEHRTRSSHQLEALTTDRNAWKDQVATLESELVRRTNDLRLLERNYRAAVAARNAMASQRTAAQEEIRRLSALNQELQGTTEQLQTARVAAAEAAALRDTLEKERAGSRRDAARARTEHTALQEEIDRLQTQLATTNTALAQREQTVAARERDLGGLQQHLDAARRREAKTEEKRQALATKLDQLRSALEKSEAERRTLAAEYAAAQQQAAALAAARGDAEKALAKQLEEAKDRLSQVEHERDQLRAVVGQARENVRQTRAAHAAAARQLQAQLQRLGKDAGALASERRNLIRRLARTRRTRTAERGRAAETRRRAATLAQRCDRVQQTLAQNETARTDLSAELAKVQAEKDKWRQQVEALEAANRESAAASRRATKLQQLLEAARSDALAAHTERARAAQEAAQLAGELERASQKAAGNAAQIRSLQKAVAQLAADKQRLERQWADQAATLDTLRRKHTAAEAASGVTAERLQAERDRAFAERDQQAAAAAAALAAADEATRLAVQQEQKIRHQFTEQQRRIDSLAELLRQRDRAIATAHIERQKLESALQTTKETLARARQEREDFQRRGRDLSAQLENERRQHTAATAALRREVAAGRELAEQAARAISAEKRKEARPVHADSGTDVADPPLVIERSAPLAAVADSKDRNAVQLSPAAADDPEAKLILVDESPLSDEAYAALHSAGIRVAAHGFNGAAEEIERRQASGIVLNLGAGVPAWRLLKVLRDRAATRDVPILPYIMKPEAANGFSLGRVDFLLWPAQSALLIERLRRLCPGLRRLLVASADIEEISKMHQPLAQERISTSIVLDGRQARDLVASLRPEAVILHLSPSCPDVARALVALRAAEPSRRLPLLLLLDQPARAREESFFSSLVRELLRHGSFEWRNLPGELACLSD